MLKISELAMPKSHTVTTVYNDRLWSDYEQAKTYFLEMMMITEGEESDRAECVYSLHDGHVDDDGVFGIPPRKSRHRHAAILLSEAWSVG